MDKIQIIENLFYNIFLFSFLLPLISLFFSKKLRKDSSCLVLLLYCVIFFFLNLFFPFFEKQGLLKIYYTAYTFLEYVLFTYIIWVKIKSKSFKILVASLSLLFFVFQVFHYYTVKIKVLDSIPIGIETILIFIYIIFYFYEQFKQPSNSYLYQNYMFWIAFGIMIYLGGSFFFNILADYITQRIIEHWPLTYIADILKSLFFLYGLLLFKSKHNGDYNNKSSSLPFLDIDFT